MIMVLVETFLEILGRSTEGAVVVEMMVFLVPLWIAFVVGVVVGWNWKPKCVNLGNCKFDFSAPSSPTAARDSSLSSALCASSDNSSISKDKRSDFDVVSNEDLEHLRCLIEKRGGGLPWKHMMDRSTPAMSYQAWQRDPEIGPPQFCTRTVYEDATPELLRDFFWDDEFRLEWDDMMVHASITEECPASGTMVSRWVRKFPFFCSDREYIIGRRIWESGRTYYCVTKGVQCHSVPRRDKPKRVDLYYSSWFIQPVESRRGSGEMTACEVVLFHHEDIGIPREIAKLGVRQGMWGTVKKIERGFRAYQKARACSRPISHYASMARVTTRIDPDHMKPLEANEGDSLDTQLPNSDMKSGGLNIPKILVVGGALVVACSFDRGLLPKAALFDITRRLVSMGRRTQTRIRT